LHGGADFRDALASASSTLRDTDSAPSARVLAVMARDFDSSYVAFTRAQSEQTRNRLLALPYPSELQARFAALTKASIAEQKRIEASDSLPFEQYRQQYLSVERLGVPGLRTAARN
jgi:glutamate--cysteine ligase